MFNVGPEKLILLFVIALVVLGPQRLPETARTLGRAVVGFRRLTSNLQAEVHGALGESGGNITDNITEAVGALREGVGTLRGGLADAVRPVAPAAPGPVATATDSGATSEPAVVGAELGGVPDEPNLN